MFLRSTAQYEFNDIDKGLDETETSLSCISQFFI